MPLHGKIVVIKRSGGDGTEFPLTATCLFGRKPDCDIRIQLPQVSKEHCRIDLNENKEVILTNLSSVNPTRVNGEALQQSERLKHGDVITIIDRSFRFEYPPAPTPKKRSSIGGKTETFKVLQDQQVGDTVTSETGKKRISAVSTGPHLKDGTNQENIQRSLEKTMELESKEEDKEAFLQNKTTSPFSDLYEMIKNSLDVKTPRKSSASLLQTPTSRFATPKPGSVKKDGGNFVISTEDKSAPKKDETDVFSGGAESNGTPKSIKKQRKSLQVPSNEMARPQEENVVNSELTSPQKRNRTAPQRFTVCEVIEQVSAQTRKSPIRRSKDATPEKSKEQEKQAVTSPKREHLRKASPRNSGKVQTERSKKRRSGELASDLPKPQIKRKQVSFGGHLNPELFDKRLPPDSPLRKGDTPRRSLSLFKPKQSLLRRASVIGLLQECEQEHPDTQTVQSPAKLKTQSPKNLSAKNASPKTKSPKSKSPSSKAATPAKTLPKSRSPSPKAATPAKKSAKSSSPSPKAAIPAKKSAKSSSPSPKAVTPGQKSPKSRSSFPKVATPGTISSKSDKPSPAKGKSPPKNKVENPGSRTPTVKGRFSVSHISTPSPVAEDAVNDKAPLDTVAPKIPLRRKSMKSTSRKTHSMKKSAIKVMCRRSNISRASMKAMNSWVDIVKFGQTKTQVFGPANIRFPKKTVKKATSKPKTPARKLQGHSSTGHANSPATIVVGRAHKQKLVQPTGAAPRLVTNIAHLKKDMNMDEDLTGISEMYKTPVNEKKRSVINESSAVKTPLGVLVTSVVEPSVLNTPEEPGEMMVSPLSVSSTVKHGKYNSEAVQRLFNEDQESSLISENAAVETADDTGEQRCTDLKTSVKTPKQRPEVPDCLTGVKKTPKQKAQPVEDLRGKILKTPKQKPEQQECFTGVKRIMKTPKQKAEPVEDLRGNILKTPKQKLEPLECLTGVKRIFDTPEQEARILQGKYVEAAMAGDTSSNDVEEAVDTPAQMQESEDSSEKSNIKTPREKNSPLACLTGIKRMMKTPREKGAPVEDMLGVKRLMNTPREKSKPVEENFGIKRLLNSPKLRCNEPVEDFDGLKELMEEALPDPAGQLETNEVEDQPLVFGVDIATELDFTHEEPQNNVPSDELDNVCEGNMGKEKEADEKEAAVDHHLQLVPHGFKELSDAVETISQVADNVPDEEPKVTTTDEDLSKEKPTVKTVTEVSELDSVTAPDHGKKTVRSTKVKRVDEEKATDHSEDPVISAPVRGRRVNKTEATAPPAVKMTRSRNAKATESSDVEVALDISAPLPSEVTLRPKRARNAKKASEDQPEKVVDEVTTEVEMEPEPDHEQSPSGDFNQEANTNSASPEKTVVRPKQGRKAKQPVAGNVPDEEPKVTTTEEDLSKEKPTVKTVTEVSELDSATAPGHGKKTVRSRKVKRVDEEKATDHSEDPVISAPVRGRRVNKTEATAPPAVKTTRSRNAKATESRDVEVALDISASLPSEIALKPKRGRNTKKASEDQPEKVLDEVTTEVEMEPEPDHEQSPSGDFNQEANTNSAPPEKTVVRPKRGRKAKQPDQAVPEQEGVPCTHNDDDLKADKEMDSNKCCSDQLDMVPSGSNENKSLDTLETAPQAPTNPTFPEGEAATCEVSEMDLAINLKKSVRGRRTKVVESKTVDEQEVAEHSEEPVAPVRERRGKKNEATAPPTVRQTTRTRNTKSQERNSDHSEIVPEKVVQTALVSETTIEAMSDQNSIIISHQQDSVAQAQETVMKPVRGRKTKQTPAKPPQPEPDKNEIVNEEQFLGDAQPQKSIPALGKLRGKNTKTDTVQQNKQTIATVETKQQSETPIRAKRGRNAKQEEKKLESDDQTNSVETTKSQEPVRKLRRTRKMEEDHIEPSVILTSEIVVPEEAETQLVAEPVKVTEQANLAAKPRRGGRKNIQAIESETPIVESTEVQEILTVSVTDEPKRGRRGKQVTNEVEVIGVVPEEKPDHELEADVKNSTEPEAPTPKPSRALAVKNKASLAIPAKRTRRGATLPLAETNAETAVVVLESESTSVEPPKRSRRAAAKPTADDAKVTSNSANPSEDLKVSKRSVKWKPHIEVFEIQKMTPVKAVRGRSKHGEQIDTKSQNVSKNASKSEEKDLSNNVEVLPAKRARRGAKIADVTANKVDSTSKGKTV